MKAVALISIIVVTHQSRRDIEDCLRAIHDPVDSHRIEIIVVDNGSQDGTAAFVRKQFPGLKVIEQANLGFGGGNNVGVAAANGDALIFVNPDTVAEPGFVQALAAAVEPGQAATAQVVLMDDPEHLNTLGHRPHFAGLGFTAGHGEPRRHGPAFAVGGFSGAAFAIRREDFQRAGGFDEDFFLYMEDTEMSWRLQRAGVKVVAVPDAVVRHDYALTVDAAKLERLETGRLLLLRKHLPWHLWLAYAPSLLVAELLAWAKAATLGRAGLAAKARSLRKGWRGGIRRYRHLPRARPHRFATRRVPSGVWGKGVVVRAAGVVVNVLFWLNTLPWALRKGRITR